MLNWWGTLLGGTFGFLLGGPLGALLGAVIGRRFDASLKGLVAARLDPGEQERVQTAFFTATFSIMGHLAKVDGQVSPQEIRLAETVMARMSLNPEMRRAAIGLFNQGKAANFALDAVVDQFRAECHRRRHLLQMFLEIQLHACYADGAVHADEERLLRHISERLGFSPWEFAQIEAMVRAAQGFAADGPYARRSAGAAPPRDALAAAYAVLGVDRSVSDKDVKAAYRRLMNQHHPDKLVAKGLPEEMVALATERTQEIKAAYEAIKAARGLR